MLVPVLLVSTCGDAFPWMVFLISCQRKAIPLILSCSVWNNHLTKIGDAKLASAADQLRCWCSSLRWDAHHHIWHAPCPPCFPDRLDSDNAQSWQDPRWRIQLALVSFAPIYRLIYVKLVFITSWISCPFMVISQCYLLCFLALLLHLE